MTVSQITFMSVEFTWEEEFSCPEDVSVNHFVLCYIDVVEVLQMWQVHVSKLRGIECVLLEEKIQFTASLAG